MTTWEPNPDPGPLDQGTDEAAMTARMHELAQSVEDETTVTVAEPAPKSSWLDTIRSWFGPKR